MLLSVISISSCQDGDLGLAYFQVLNNSGNTTSFYTSDPNIPSTFLTNYNYSTKEGTYNYSYIYSVFTYTGTYTIVQDKGDAWNGLSDGMLTKPASGPKRNYTFDCDAVSGSELSWTRSHLITSHDDIIINKTIYFNGGKMIIKGKGVYDPKHLLNTPKHSVCINKSN